VAFVKGDEQAVRDATATGAKHLRCGAPSAIARHYRAIALGERLAGDDRKTHGALQASLAAYPLLETDPALNTPEMATAWQLAQEQPLTFRTGTPQLVNGLRTPLTPTTAHVGRGSGRGMRTIGLALGVVATGLYGSAWVSRNTFNGTVGQPAVERLPSYRATNALSIASVTTALAGGTLLGVSFAL
jgi:hypothetical protein